MSSQTIISINFGQNETGKQRLRLYKKRIKERGYDSLSAFMIEIADKKLSVKLPKIRAKRVI